jgi:uncharacterized membrane protein
MPKKKSVDKVKKTDDSKLFAFLATFLSILGFIIALVAKKDDKYVMFYAKQSLVVFIAYIIAAVIKMLPGIGSILGPIAYLITSVLWIFSWVYALSGEEKDTPFIGQYIDKIKL